MTSSQATAATLKPDSTTPDRRLAGQPGVQWVSGDAETRMGAACLCGAGVMRACSNDPSQATAAMYWLPGSTTPDRRLVAQPNVQWVSGATNWIFYMMM